MKNFQKISVIILYILFSQVYPFSHWHAHEHQGQIEIELSLHPPEYPVESHIHEDHKCQSHDQDVTQFIGDRNYTPPAKNLNFKFTEQHFFSTNILAKEPQVLSHNSQENPGKIPENYLTRIFSERAPPKIC